MRAYCAAVITRSILIGVGTDCWKQHGRRNKKNVVCCSFTLDCLPWLVNLILSKEKTTHNAFLWLFIVALREYFGKFGAVERTQVIFVRIVRILIVILHIYTILNTEYYKLTMKIIHKLSNTVCYWDNEKSLSNRV